MDQKYFIECLEKEHLRCVEISRKKNADYATPQDAFANFRASEEIGIDAEQAILVRMLDKIKRTSNLLKQDPHTTDESIADTLRDLSNYALILLLFHQYENQEY